MKSKRLSTVFTALFAVPVMFLSPGGIGDEGAGAQGRNRYIGADRCRNCHRAEESGDQHGVWLENRHAKAFETLASDAAKKYAQERGIADPQKAEECMKCHDTGFGMGRRELHRSFKANLGVQCESCHGPGENHQKARLAAAAAEEAPAKFTVIPAGEMITAIDQKTCLQCHNDQSPGFKPFCFYKSVAVIRHLNPLKPRTEEQLAALLVCGCGENCECVNGCEDGKCGVPPVKK